MLARLPEDVLIGAIAPFIGHACRVVCCSRATLCMRPSAKACRFRMFRDKCLLGVAYKYNNSFQFMWWTEQQFKCVDAGCRMPRIIQRDLDGKSVCIPPYCMRCLYKYVTCAPVP